MNILCIATYFKGETFLRECRQQGCTVILLTVDSLKDAEWPRESIDEIHTIPRDAPVARSGDRHQEGRRSRRAVEGASRRRRRPVEHGARAVRARRGVSRRFDRVAWRRRVRGRVQVWTSADGDRA